MALDKNNKMKDGGRDTKYKPEYGEQAFKLIKQAGFNITQLADFFGVHRDTIYEWKKAHPKRFSDTVDHAKIEKEKKDIEDVKNSLLDKATGKAKTRKVKQIVDDAGKPVGSKEVVITEHPPETKAIEYFLGNRDPENWKNKAHNEVTGLDGKDLMKNADSLSDEAIASEIMKKFKELEDTSE